MDTNNRSYSDLPAGFSVALAQDLNALDHFAALPSVKQQIVIEKARHINSKEEMRSYVNDLKSF
ncbi:MAG: hypothetical protein RR911_02270 [Oscillospiraceae bacterium]